MIYNIKEFKHKTRGKTNTARYFARNVDYGKKAQANAEIRMAEFIDKYDKETQERAESERLQKIEQDLIEQEYNENEAPSVINMVIEMGGINDSFYSGEMRGFAFKESGIKGIINKSSKTSFARMAESIAERTGNENHRDASWLIDAIANEIPRFKRNEKRFKPDETKTKGWGENFKNVSLLTNATTLINHVDYEAAKAGDVEAAERVVDSFLTAKNPKNKERIKKILELKKTHPNAIIVGVHAEEAKGKNAIPQMLAKRISVIDRT